jgi:hypothetical protein
MTVEQRLARLEGAVKVTDDAVYIAADKKIVIKALVIEIEANATVTVKGSAAVEVSGGASLTLQGGATVFVKGGIVRLNNGSNPVATVGSRVVPLMPPLSKVDSGTATVLA